MATKLDCPDGEQLKRLLHNDLTTREQAIVVRHLDSCTDCQALLEDLAVGDASWARTARKGDTPPPRSEFWHAMRELKRELSGSTTPRDDELSRTTAQYEAVADEVALDFLAPAEAPGYVGKLGHFNIVRIIGRGGMGIVLEGFDGCLQRPVALKVLDPKLATNELARKRFCREARAAASITHEHVVAVHQVDEDERSGLPFLVMQLVTGESLEDRLHKTRLELTEVVRIGMQTAAGLAAAHVQGLIHRDIKPGNILLEHGTDRVKLTDFGLARATEDLKLTQTGFVAGTPLYMSPEQAKGDELDPRSDLFSLGTVLYELTGGRPPFDGDSALIVLRKLTDQPHRPIHELSSDTPAWFAGIIDRLLAKKPADRFQSATDVAALLAEHLGQLQPLSPLEVPAMPGRRSSLVTPISRGRRWVTALLVLVALICGFILGEVSGTTRVCGFLFFGPCPYEPASGTQESYLRQTLTVHTGPIRAAVFTPDGKTLAMGLYDGTLRLYDPETGRVRATIDAHRLSIWGAAVSLDGKWLATGSDDQTVKIWDVAEQKEAKSLPHPAGVHAVAFAQDSQRLVSATIDGGLFIWDLANDAGPMRLKGHEQAIEAVAFAPDGQTVASASGDKTVKLWDTVTGQEQVTLRGHEGGVYSVAFDRDGQMVATGSWDRTIRLWDAGSGNLLKTLKGHEQDVWSVAFCPDCRLLASGSQDGTVRLWDVGSGEELAALKGHTGAVNSVAFSADGHTLVTGGGDGTVRLWNVPHKE